MSRDQIGVIVATVLAVAILALMPNRLWLPIGEAIGFVFALLVFRWIWLSYRDFKGAPAAAALRRQQILSGQFPTGTGAGQPSVSTCLAMDWNIEDTVATLVVFNDGTVSLYFYPRSGIAGAARFENVRRAATPFREELERLRSRLTPASSFPLPAPNHLIFYLVAEAGTLSSGELKVDEVREQGHPFFTVDGHARQLIREVCRTTPGVPPLPNMRLKLTDASK